jgi:hypothetical protein
VQLHLFHDALAGCFEPGFERVCVFAWHRSNPLPRILSFLNRFARGAPLRIVGAVAHGVTGQR